jgi:hypothetical protein
MTQQLLRAGAFATVFITVTMFGFLIHGVVLRDGYLAVAQLHRTAPLIPSLLLANLAFTGGAIWLFSSSRPSRGIWRDGLTFGLKLWVFWPVPLFLIAYSSQPIPGTLVAMQIGFELVDMLLIGTLIAALYGDRLAASARAPLTSVA